MSLGIVFKGPEGIVLAADSRVTLTASRATQHGTVILPATYDNATKLLRVAGQDYVGVVTYGLGAIGTEEPRTAHSFIPEFEAELSGRKRLPIHEFAEALSKFFLRRWNDEMPKGYKDQDMTFLVGGYDEGASYGRVFQLDIPSNPTPKEQQGGKGQFGIVWGGQREYADRLIQGFDEALPLIAQQVLKLPDEKRDELREALRANLQVAIPFQFLPLQDCVDLSVFLIRSTITIQNWIVGLRGVGGFIDIATVTRTDGFKPIQNKRVEGERP